jgi:hypothetical protein
MLEPQPRMLLLDALRPPAGFTFDEGIGTTFSLDLLTLLTAPLAFTLFDAQDPAHAQVAGSLEVLHSARQYAGKLTVFCHASYVSVPKAILAQYAFLEGSIVECQGRNRGLFHPKVWLLRFVGTGGERAYRLLCLTRNLTFANSWDTALVLEGSSTGRPLSRNRPLVDFIASLPDFATRPASQAVRDRITRLVQEVETVHFALPDKFTDLRFWPIGLSTGPVWPFERLGRRLAVISPFVTAGCLERLGAKVHDATVVSTRDDLMKLHRRPTGFTNFRVLHDSAVADFLDSEAAAGERDAAQLSGLHAKCYVTEIGDAAHVWTGSANATDAAFSNNVEFVTELVGPRQLFGIEALLGQRKDEVRFGNLLQDASDIVATKQEDPEEEDLRTRVELARSLLAEAMLRATAEAGGHEHWTVTVSGRLPEPLPSGLAVWCWPLAASGRRQRLADGQVVLLTYPELSFEALSAFLVCRIEARAGGRSLDCQFVLTVPLDGAPSDRAERILRAVVNDRAALMRFLFLLLADEGEGLISTTGGTGGTDGVWQWSHAMQPGLFELLVRAVEQRPARLDEIARLIADLTKDSSKDQILPPGFMDVWTTVWAAHTEAAGV